MKRKHAYEAIKAILAAIDDDEMPQPDKVDLDGDKTVVWFGGMGSILGSAKRNGEREPLIYRDRAASDAIQMEAVYRFDLTHKTNRIRHTPGHREGLDMSQHLWEIDHPYYGPEGSFWANWHQQGPDMQSYESWADFIEEGGMADADLDMNWCYRWDWQRSDPDDYKYEVKENPDFEMPGDTLELFWMMPRKGIMARSTINVTEADEPAVREWLQVRADYMRTMWEPLL